ncbi:MAG: methyltransferase [Polyangiaceae bacterium]
MARRARRHFRGGRVVDLAAGHGLLAHVMLLLDDTSPRAVAVDTRVPKSAPRVHDALVAAWPRLRDRVVFEEGDLSSFPLRADDVVVSAHACGDLTDTVLARASEVGARVVVLPCCHDERDRVGSYLEGWLDPALALDVARVERLRQRGYTVRTQHIPAEVTPKNRLLLAAPPSRTSPARADSR